MHFNIPQETKVVQGFLNILMMMQALFYPVVKTK
jgi:hypothetical protein